MKTAFAALALVLVLLLVPFSLFEGSDSARAAPSPKSAASQAASRPASQAAAKAVPASAPASAAASKATSKPAAPDPEKIVAVIYFDSHLGRVKFPHREHVTDYGASCTSCHHATKAGPIKTPHNQYFADSGIACAQCHGRKTPATAQACRACHYDYSKSKGCSDKTPSPRLAIHTACWKCHKQGKGVKASNACTFCHAGKKKPW